MKTPAFWRTRNLTSLALWPLSQLYLLGVSASRSDITPKQAPLMVISIGNVTAGGAGKTPTALALLPMLRELGTNPHFVTRGYKSSSPLAAHRVTEEDTAATVGDEPMLLSRIAPTWVGRERLASATAAQAAGATLVVCDDALQHHRLQKDLSFLVIDGPYGLGNRFLLPAGPLREPLTDALERCDAAIIIGDDAQQWAEKITLPVFTARLMPTVDAATLGTGPWFAFAGIGRPEKFTESLLALGLDLVGSQAFPDHHHYTDEEFAGLRDAAAQHGARLITTEKDAVKLTPEHRAKVAVLPVSLAFDAPEMLQQFLKDALVAFTERQKA